jgi:hypothetical protein
MRILFLLLFITSCQNPDTPKDHTLKKKNQVREFISRSDGQFTYIPPMEMVPPTIYPWEKENSLPKITKEYFRCKGSSLNPVRSESVGGGVVKYHDCGGCERHSLPLKESKEFIYPILIDLLNHIQEQTGKRLVITSGHRCPDHNSYVDPFPLNQYSKHQIGAEVDFYVQGMENNPESLLNIIFAYYKNHPEYKNKKEYREFTRYEKNDSNVSIQPWMNKEIFIKLYKANEGRNLDNRHPYPYISIQVRYDSAKNQRVSYSWDQAFSNFLRY